MSLQDLPPHLLYNILTKGSLSASDLAHFEASCYAFRAAHGLLPLRFKSIAEVAALDLSQKHPLFSSLPPPFQSKLLQRCGKNWKMLLRYLQSREQANGFVTTPKGKLLVATGRYHSILNYGADGVFVCGRGPPFGESDEPPCHFFAPVTMPGAASVAQISSYFQHAAFVTTCGELYTCGKDTFGCCGLGEVDKTIIEPTLVATLTGVCCKQVATGMHFTVVLTMEGHVYTCGTNQHGQLGHGDEAERHVPTKLERLGCSIPIIQVSAGVTHALAVSQYGGLYSWGYGGNLCLGHGGHANEAWPRLVKKFQDDGIFVVNAAAGDEHSVAMDSNGQVYTWGKGYCGALGRGNEDDAAIPERVEGLDNVQAVQVCARKRKTFVLGDDGRLFAFGWMSCGSLGLRDRGMSEKVLVPSVVDSLKGHHIAQVSSGQYHTVVLTREGTILGFGDNEIGQLGSRPCTSYWGPVDITS